MLESGCLSDAENKRRAVWITQDGIMDLNGFIHFQGSRTRAFGFSRTEGIGD